MAYVKLFGSILASTIWQEVPETKVVWITMLAMADRDGLVEASVPGLAKLAGVELPECEEAIKCLEGPDLHSRTKDHGGRRIKPVHGGWLLLNYEFYRDKASAEEKRQKDAARQRRKYDRDKALKTSRDPHAAHGSSPAITKPRLSSDLISSDLISSGKKSTRAQVQKPDDVEQDVWDDWVRHRKKKGGTITARVLKSAREKADMYKRTLNAVLAQWTLQNHQGFFAPKEWEDALKGDRPAQRRTGDPSRFGKEGDFLQPGEDPVQSF